MIGCSQADRIESGDLLRDGGEYWESLSIDGKRVGFQKTSLRHETIDGAPMMRFDLQSRLTILRHGGPFDVAMKMSAVSNHDGDFVSSVTEMSSAGKTPIRTECKVDANQLLVEGEKDGKTIPWPVKYGGPDAILRHLIKHPVAKNAKAAVSFFDPVLLQHVSASLEGGSVEPFDIQGTRRNLQRVDVRFSIGDDQEARNLSTTLWTDVRGNVFRSVVPMGTMEIVAERVDQQTALAEIDGLASVELGEVGMVSLNKPITDANFVPRITFLVQLKHGSPQTRFPETPFQSVIPLKESANAAKIRVWSAVGDDPKKIGNSAFNDTEDTTSDDALASGVLVNSDDPKLREFVAKIDVSSLSPWETARKLEQLVHESMHGTTFSVAFAPSSEVLKTMSGDCTEYAVLLAAACRLKKIPCRLVLGLVYSPLKTAESAANGAMAFHLWNEVLVDGVWRPLDATFGQGGANAARLKIADVDLSGDSFAALTNSVLGVVDQLRVEVIE